MNRRNLFAKLAGLVGAVCTGAVVKAAPVKKSTVVRDVVVNVRVGERFVVSPAVQDLMNSTAKSLRNTKDRRASWTFEGTVNEHGQFVIECGAMTLTRKMDGGSIG